MKKILFLVVLVVATVLTGCEKAAKVASKNVSDASDNFEVLRRVVFFNGITDKYLLSVEGFCSIDVDRPQLISVICKVGPNEYKKHYCGLSDNVSYFVEQVAVLKVSTYHYKVRFRPQTIVPDIDFQGDKQQLIDSVTPGS